MTKATSTPEDRRLILLSRVIIVLHRILERSATNEKLSLPQYRFLLALKRGIKRSSQLAESAGISRPTASALVEDLEKKGIIERVADPTDGRATNLKLTPQGLKIYASFETILAQELRDCFPDGWPEEILEAAEQLAFLIDER